MNEGISIYYTDHFVLPLPESHRFPMSKYSLLRERVAQAELVPSDRLRIPPAATDEELLLAHSPEYLRKVKTGELSDMEVRRMGFPWSPGLVERSRRSVGATIQACRSALRFGRGINLAGGTHHAFRETAGGYCVFNDAIVAARVIQQQEKVQRVAIVDCDVHQGDGTAALAAGDDSIFTFSIHGEKNYPYQKQTSDLDVGLPDETGDEEYLNALRSALNRVQAIEPEFVIYLAGADPYRNDRLGRLALTKPGLAARDQLVLETFASQRVPVAVTMSGGYARQIEDIVDIHFETVRFAAQEYCW